MVLTYRGVASAEVEVVARSMAEPLEAQVVFVAPEPGPVVAVNPHRLIEAGPLDDGLDPFGLIVPGGLGWRREAGRAELREWLPAAVAASSGVLAISTGTLLLASFGLIEGDEAAGHWLAAELMAGFGVNKSTARVVHDRLLVTASGALAGAQAGAELAQAMRFSPWVKS